jgi:probable rRNA maturation factor
MKWMSLIKDAFVMSLTVEVTTSEDLFLTNRVSETADDVVQEEDIPEPALLQAWAAAAYLDDVPAVASVLVTTPEEMQQLNKQYRGKDQATNVLSFPMQSPEEVDLYLLGDLVLCASVIKQEAEQQKKSEMSHWAHMVVHGMLHLQGYDHMENEEAEEMEKLEASILNQLGFGDPY